MNTNTCSFDIQTEYIESIAYRLMIPLLHLLLVIFSTPTVVPAQSAQKQASIGIAPVSHTGNFSKAMAVQVQGVFEFELQNAPRIHLIERSRLTDVLAEASFQQSGITSSESATDLGVQHNVEYLLFTHVSRYFGKYHLQVKLVSVSTGEIMWTDSKSLGTSADAFLKRTVVVAQRIGDIAVALIPTKMILHKSSEFVMGSTVGAPNETPEHLVYVDAFFLDRTEVSKASYDLYARRNDRSPSNKGFPDTPATRINWFDAQEYCRASGNRLPTEAEWEYAARGAAGNTYPWGMDEPTSINSRHGGGQGPNPIDHHASGASENGVLNLAGNVSEWVSDWWDPTFYRHSRGRNPNGPIDGDYKVVRGGSWADTDFDLRSAARSFHTPNRGAAYIGFRCARSSKPNS